MSRSSSCCERERNRRNNVLCRKTRRKRMRAALINPFTLLARLHLQRVSLQFPPLLWSSHSPRFCVPMPLYETREAGPLPPSNDSGCTDYYRRHGLSAPTEQNTTFQSKTPVRIRSRTSMYRVRVPYRGTPAIRPRLADTLSQIRAIWWILPGSRNDRLDKYSKYCTVLSYVPMIRLSRYPGPCPVFYEYEGA
jgi:hypothetical protein